MGQQPVDRPRGPASRIAALAAHLLSGLLPSRPGTEDARSRDVKGDDVETSVTDTHTGKRVCSPIITIHPEVRQALAEGRPVVALESSIISQGMPYPQNIETALSVEAIVRAEGAVPATIAILGGVPHVGLTEEQVHRLGAPGAEVLKCSRRDLAYVCGLGRDAATTVSTTMLLAHQAGIRLFVTGGIGGVHRGYESTMDVSADITELMRTPVAVVCAGAKSILDIPRTLEALETSGVSVATMRSDEFPAFYTRASGCRSPCRVDSEEDAARMIQASRALGLDSGQLIAVPIPEESEAMGDEMERAVQEALGEATEQLAGGGGNAATPFLLGRVAQLTGGRSLKANVALVENNARVGARIAVFLSQLEREGSLQA